MDFTEIQDGDRWENFCREFFDSQGFVVEIPPGRGPDAGRDLVLREVLSGHLHSSPFRWLVSCKHFAQSAKAVGVGDEENILERMRQHRCNGFIGFYSSTPSAALVQRLTDLRSAGDMSEFKIFDAEIIKKDLIYFGMSRVLMQYLPSAYQQLRPIHAFAGKYLPLNCIECGDDILAESVINPNHANIIFVKSFIDDHDAKVTRSIEEVHVVCKGECDRKVQDRLRHLRKLTNWDDFGDFTNPLLYMKRVCALANSQRNKTHIFSNEAFKQYLDIFIAAGQITLRHHSKEELDRYLGIAEVERLGL